MAEFEKMQVIMVMVRVLSNDLNQHKFKQANNVFIIS